MNIKTNTSLAAVIGCLALVSIESHAAVTYLGGTTGTETEVSSTSRNAYDGSTYTGDLLAGLTPTDVSGWFSATRGPDKLADGIVNGASVANTAQTAGGGSALATFNLGTGANGLGFDLNSILSIAAWGDSGFDDQVWMLEVAGVSASPSFSELLSVDYRTANGGGATKVTISDLSGSLTSGVQYVRVTGLDNPSGSNGRFLWQELDISGISTAVPEPSVAILGALGGLLLLRRRR